MSTSSATARLSGVFAAAITPLDADGRPDPKRAGSYCARLLDEGCDGINVLGTTGEAVSFSLAERIAVMEGIAQAVDPARCMVGTGASAFEDVAALTLRALELGYGGVLVIPPFYYTGLTEDETVAWYERLIERIADDRLRVYLYHFPAYSGVPITRPIVSRLVERYPQTVVGLKDSEGYAGFAERIVGAHPEFAVFPSNEARLHDAAQNGFAGCISATVQLAAPHARRVWRGSAASRDVERAHAALIGVREVVSRYGVIPGVRHVAARLHRDPLLARPAAPLTALPADRAQLLDTEIAMLPALADRLSEALDAPTDV